MKFICAFLLFPLLDCLYQQIPVVYIIFGPIPAYLLVNIELATRLNPVIVIGDSFKDSQCSSLSLTHKHVRPYISSANQFSQRYVHLAGKDVSKQRITHELQNFQRWFILRDFMKLSNLSHAFFGDGDSSIFANMTRAYQDRFSCDAVLNVEIQTSNFHWVGAGEASLWTMRALDSFCDFTLSVYSKPVYVRLLQTKNVVRPAVVDMSLLWLWWTQHFTVNDTDWIVGRPSAQEAAIDPKFTATPSPSRQKNLLAFRYAKSLPLPSVSPSLTLCNGLDVVKATAFDHMHGFKGSNFSLGVFEGSSTARPYITSPRTIHGGRASDSFAGKLYLLNLHYQGNSKSSLSRDVCKVFIYC